VTDDYIDEARRLRAQAAQTQSDLIDVLDRLAKATTPPRRRQARPAFPITVAIVEDDESVGRSCARMLRAGGIDSVIYRSSEAFLADQARPWFECLVLDVHLGTGMSGLELSRVLAGQGATRTPIIYMTAHDDPHTRAAAMAGGCASVLSKKDSGDQLRAAIRTAVVDQRRPRRMASR